MASVRKAATRCHSRIDSLIRAVLVVGTHTVVKYLSMPRSDQELLRQVLACFLVPS